MWQLKRRGFSDVVWLSDLVWVKRPRWACPVYKRVDTCAAEFSTRGLYVSTYEGVRSY